VRALYRHGAGTNRAGNHQIEGGGRVTARLHHTRDFCPRLTMVSVLTS
jgi:hypothetical protein